MRWKKDWLMLELYSSESYSVMGAAGTGLFKKVIWIIGWKIFTQRTLMQNTRRGLVVRCNGTIWCGISDQLLLYVFNFGFCFHFKHYFLIYFSDVWKIGHRRLQKVTSGFGPQHQWLVPNEKIGCSKLSMNGLKLFHKIFEMKS